MPKKEKNQFTASYNCKVNPEIWPFSSGVHIFHSNPLRVGGNGPVKENKEKGEKETKVIFKMF